ncbi:MAG: DNA alkylation repair protein [Dehalococcoidales bacterium]|nr:DNA alkylation repair protein [Dehalococcoidales bacterium]
MATVEEILDNLKSKAKPDQLEGMARYGISIKQRLGVSVPDMRKIARELGKDHRIALDLWNTGIDEAKILAAMIDDRNEITDGQMEDWVRGINSWDVCDQVCMNLFEKSPLVWRKITDWSEREEEFTKRTAFSLIARLAWHDKTAKDEQFVEFFPLIIRESNDDRNFVKKAVNWALRNIGKRNINLNKKAINTAKIIQKIDSKAARWIAADVIRELESDAVQRRVKNNQLPACYAIR